MSEETLKVIWQGPVFNPTGIATSAREMIKALVKKGVKIQCLEPWNSSYDFNQGLDHLNNPIDTKEVDATIVYDYPQFWRNWYGKKKIGSFIHEGTKLFPDWVPQLNKADKLFVAAKSVKNLFRWNGVEKPMTIAHYGVDADIYKPKEHQKETDDFLFLSVNSWTGAQGDRKGTDLLLRAFYEEFKDQENVKLLLKIGTFWDPKPAEFYMQAIAQLLGEIPKNILLNQTYVSEEDLAEYYQKSDCFVSPTRGEGFGLTILNAMACGLPAIVTKDNNSGHMDFCKGRESVLFVDSPELLPADPRFYCEGNLLVEPVFEQLKKQMRYAYENRKELKQKALKESEDIRKNWTWENCADKIIEVIKDDS